MMKGLRESRWNWERSRGRCKVPMGFSLKTRRARCPVLRLPTKWRGWYDWLWLPNWWILALILKIYQLWLLVVFMYWDHWIIGWVRKGCVFFDFDDTLFQTCDSYGMRRLFFTLLYQAHNFETHWSKRCWMNRIPTAEQEWQHRYTPDDPFTDHWKTTNN